MTGILKTILLLPTFWFSIWTAPPADLPGKYLNYAASVVMAFIVLYGLAYLADWALRRIEIHVESLAWLMRAIIGAGVLFLAGPFLIPVLALYAFAMLMVEAVNMARGRDTGNSTFFSTPSFLREDGSGTGATVRGAFRWGWWLIRQAAVLIILLPAGYGTLRMADYLMNPPPTGVVSMGEPTVELPAPPPAAPPAHVPPKAAMPEVEMDECVKERDALELKSPGICSRHPDMSFCSCK